MEVDIRVSDPKLFKSKIKTLAFGLDISMGYPPFFFKDRKYVNIGDTWDAIESIKIDELKNKSNNIYAKNITVSSMENIWWKCISSHSFKRRPIDFLDRGSNTSYLRSFNTSHFVLDSPETLCPICNDKKFWGFSFDEIFGLESSNRSNNKIAFATKDSTTNRWNCTTCKESWSVLSDESWRYYHDIHSYELRDMNIIYRDSSRKLSLRETIKRFYGVCFSCNSDILLPGFNDLSRGINKFLLSYWDPKKNAGLKPEDMFDFEDSYRIKFWWKCKNNHSQELSIREAIFIKNCPTCDIPNFDFEYDLQDGLGLDRIFSEFNGSDDSRQKNIILSYSNYLSVLETPFLWKCAKKDHEWKSSLMKRIKNPYCPKCGLSAVESDFRDMFCSFNAYTFSNYSHEKVKVLFDGVNRTYQIDILDRKNKIAIEYDGYYYHGYGPYKTKTIAFKDDLEKTKALLEDGYKFIRIREGVLEHIDFIHKDFFQISYTKKEPISKIVKKCINFLEESDDFNT